MSFGSCLLTGYYVLALSSQQTAGDTATVHKRLSGDIQLLAGQEACVRLMYHIIDDSAALRFITTAPNGTSSTLVITSPDGSEGTTVLRIWLRYDT